MKIVDLSPLGRACVLSAVEIWESMPSSPDDVSETYSRVRGGPRAAALVVAHDAAVLYTWRRRRLRH